MSNSSLSSSELSNRSLARISKTSVTKSSYSPVDQECPHTKLSPPSQTPTRSQDATAATPAAGVCYSNWQHRAPQGGFPSLCSVPSARVCWSIVAVSCLRAGQLSLRQKGLNAFWARGVDSSVSLTYPRHSENISAEKFLPASRKAAHHRATAAE